MPLELMATRGALNGTAYSAHGRGEVVVLIHGVGMQHAVWEPQINELSVDYQVIAYDMLGHGASRTPPQDVSLADYAAQLAALLDYLCIPAANVIGHSMGALVALEFALTHPARTLRVAALNAVFRRSPAQRASVQARAAALLKTGVLSTLEPTISRWFGEPVPPSLQTSATTVKRFLEAVNTVGYARTYQLFSTSDMVHDGRLVELLMPALFMTGEDDLNSSPSMSQAMSQQAIGSSLVIIPTARHMMNLTDSQRINKELRRFLGCPLIPKQ
jgi:pimeloyl-ACP methyl ester carboxylesterase